MNLRRFRPFRIGVRHRLVGIAIEILGALRLNVRIGPCRLPHTAEIAAAFKDGHLVSASGECLRCGKAGDARAYDANILLLDHGTLPLFEFGETDWARTDGRHMRFVRAPDSSATSLDRSVASTSPAAPS